MDDKTIDRIERQIEGDYQSYLAVEELMPEPTQIKPKPKPLPELSLVGRCFHIFGDAGQVQYQGIVRGNLGDGNYLIQYFEWTMGEQSSLAIVHISKMIQPDQRRGPGAWQFYENSEHMNFWYEYRAPKRPPEP